MSIRGAAYATALAAGALVIAGCGRESGRAFGEPVDPASAVPLSKLLAGERLDRAGPVAVSGRIGEVCRSAGCWFVLQDGEGADFVEILVDLKPAASFTVPANVGGRETIVKGRLVGEKPDLQINAIGVLLIEQRTQ